MISAQGLTKRYRQNEGFFNAVNSVSLDLPSRGLVCLMGESGAGKTTLLNLLALLDTPTEGKLAYGDTIITKKNAAHLRNQFASFVTQEKGLIEDLTVQENLSFLSQNQQEIIEALSEVGIESKSDSKVCDLSGGEKKRVSIARCLLKKSICIFMDEPTADLDEKNAEGIFRLAKVLAKDHLVVVSTHDADLARQYGEFFISMAHGKIIENTIPKEECSSNLPIKMPDPKVPLRTFHSFFWNTIHFKSSRFWGSFAASSLLLCLFCSLFSFSNFQPKKAFSSALSKNDISFVPILEKPASPNSGNYPIRSDSIDEAKRDFGNATPFLAGTDTTSDLPVFVLPYQKGMHLRGEAVQNPKVGECVCSSFLSEKSNGILNLNLNCEFSSSSISLSVKQKIGNFEAAPTPSAFSNQSLYYEALLQRFTYVIINEDQFSNAFSISNPANVTASDFLADIAIPNERYFKSRTKYKAFVNAEISLGRAPEAAGEVAVSESYLSRSPYSNQPNEILGKTFSYRDIGVRKETSDYFRKCIDLSAVFGQVKIVGITSDSTSDVFLSEKDSMLLSKELLYFSGGVLTQVRDLNTTSSTLADFHYVGSLPALECVYQARQFATSAIEKLLPAVAIALLIMLLITIFAFCVSLFDYRRQAAASLNLCGIKNSSLFPLFLSFGAFLSLISLCLGVPLALLVLFLFNRALYGSVSVFFFSWLSLIPTLCTLVFAVVATNAACFIRYSKTPLPITFR